MQTTGVNNMTQFTDIGLSKQASENLAAQLNNLLSNYQIQYMNARGFHWNIKGKNFFELHLKFEEIYDQLLLKVDELAERILTIGGQPLHAFSDYLERAEIQEAKNITVEDFKKIKLDEMLTMNRQTGFYEMVEKMLRKI